MLGWLLVHCFLFSILHTTGAQGQSATVAPDTAGKTNQCVRWQLLLLLSQQCKAHYGIMLLQKQQLLLRQHILTFCWPGVSFCSPSGNSYDHTKAFVCNACYMFNGNFTTGHLSEKMIHRHKTAGPLVASQV